MATMAEAETLKTKVLKSFQVVNTLDLYNALQNPFYSIFIDIRLTQKSGQQRVRNTLHIPVQVDADNHSIQQLIKKYKAEHCKHFIVALYCFADDTENSLFWDCLLRFRDIFDAQKLYVLTESIHKFTQKYPFLLQSETDNDMDITDEKKENNCVNILVEKHSIQYPNMIIEDSLFLGDSYHATMKSILSDLGITHVVNCTKQGTVACAFPDDIVYMRVPVHDAYDQDIQPYFEAVGKFIDEALQPRQLGQHTLKTTKINVNTNNKVMVHCQAGISRSSSMVISYLMRYKQMRLNDALLFVRQKRPIVEPNSSFIVQLRLLEKQLFGAHQNEEIKKGRQSLVLPSKIRKNINVRPPFGKR